MTELVEGEGKMWPLFFAIIKNIGTPFFTNEERKGGFIPPEPLAQNPPSQPYQLLVFQQIINLYNGQRRCSLYKFCKTRPDCDITNENCLQAPWLRAQEEELCPFGQLWKTWGLTGETPVWK